MFPILKKKLFLCFSPLSNKGLLFSLATLMDLTELHDLPYYPLTL